MADGFSVGEIIHIDSTGRATHGFGPDGKPLNRLSMMIQEGRVLRDCGEWLLVDLPTAYYVPRADVERGPLTGQSRRWVARLHHLIETAGGEGDVDHDQSGA